MKSIVRKTKDNTGATIIMALLFMLVCVMVSTVLLAAAGTASRDVSRQKEQQQAYLAVSSAIGLLKNDIENCKVSEEGTSAAVDQAFETEMAFSPLLEEGKKTATEEVPYRKIFVMDVENQSELKLKVNVEFKMTGNGRIEVTCSADKEKDHYRMKAIFKPDESEDETSVTWTKWTLSSVKKVAAETEEE